MTERGRRVAESLVLGSLVVAGAWTAFELNRAVWQPGGEAERLHASIVGGTALYPHQYRPLVPWLVELGARLGVPVAGGYLLQRIVFGWLAMLVLRGYLSRWLRDEAAFAGAALTAGLLGFSTLGQGFQETDPLCLLLFCLAFDRLAARRDAWLLVIVPLGMTCRETVGLLVLVAAVARGSEWRTLEFWRLILAMAAGAATVWLVTRLGYGPREPFTDLVSPLANLPANLSRPGSLRAVVLFGPIWVLGFVGWRSLPEAVRAGLVLVPLFVVVHLGWGLLGETRYFVPLAPALLPGALRAIFPGAWREPCA